MLTSISINISTYLKNKKNSVIKITFELIMVFCVHRRTGTVDTISELNNSVKFGCDSVSMTIFTYTAQYDAYWASILYNYDML